MIAMPVVATAAPDKSGLSVNGNILRMPFAGTNQVNPNCSISETIALGNQTREWSS
jgi:hypothetical protein